MASGFLASLLSDVGPEQPSLIKKCGGATSAAIRRLVAGRRGREGERERGPEPGVSSSSGSYRGENRSVKSGEEVSRRRTMEQQEAAANGQEDGEMPATEKDLAEDAPWKKIQQNTFTRWCNEHLKCMNKRIGDLQKDLSDGLKLIGLLEVLSQKKMYRKYHSRPNFRQMKLENVSVALEFLDRERIKLVSIGKNNNPFFPPHFSSRPSLLLL
eukprot:g39675.t1